MLRTSIKENKEKGVLNLFLAFFSLILPISNANPQSKSGNKTAKSTCRLMATETHYTRPTVLSIPNIQQEIRLNRMNLWYFKTIIIDKFQAIDDS